MTHTHTTHHKHSLQRVNMLKIIQNVYKVDKIIHVYTDTYYRDVSCALYVSCMFWILWHLLQMALERFAEAIKSTCVYEVKAVACLGQGGLIYVGIWAGRGGWVFDFVISLESLPSPSAVACATEVCPASIADLGKAIPGRWSDLFFTSSESSEALHEFSLFLWRFWKWLHPPCWRPLKLLRPVSPSVKRSLPQAPQEGSQGSTRWISAWWTALPSGRSIGSSSSKQIFSHKVLTSVEVGIKIVLNLLFIWSWTQSVLFAVYLSKLAWVECCHIIQASILSSVLQEDQNTWKNFSHSSCLNLKTHRFWKALRSSWIPTLSIWGWRKAYDLVEWLSDTAFSRKILNFFLKSRPISVSSATSFVMFFLSGPWSSGHCRLCMEGGRLCRAPLRERSLKADEFGIS